MLFALNDLPVELMTLWTEMENEGWSERFKTKLMKGEWWGVWDVLMMSD